MKLIIICVFISLFSCSKKTEVIKHTYETDDTLFYNGEILLPDYVHTDTLVITDAKFLNEQMENYNISSDGDINDLLMVTTKKY